MKRLIITLFTALTFPSFVNAETFYLSCFLNELEEKERDMKTSKQIKYSKRNQKRKIIFALNELIPTASVSFDGSRFLSYAEDETTFRFNEIKLIRQKEVFSHGTYGSVGYTINREDGNVIFLDVDINPSTDVRTDIKWTGSCEKFNRKKTLF